MSKTEIKLVNKAFPSSHSRPCRQTELLVPPCKIFHILNGLLSPIFYFISFEISGTRYYNSKTRPNSFLEMYVA